MKSYKICYWRMSIKLSGKNSPIGRGKGSWKRGYNNNLFFWWKMFDLDGIYNSENDRIWAVNREKAKRGGGKKIARKVWRKSDDMVISRPRTVHSSLNRFFLENCVVLTVLFQELCQVTSSFSRTVSSDQFFFKNCVKWPVLFQELCQMTSSFSRTVSSDQFFFKNCVRWPVLFRELCQGVSSFPRTVSNDRFFFRICDNSSALVKRTAAFKQVFFNDWVTLRASPRATVNNLSLSQSFVKSFVLLENYFRWPILFLGIVSNE